AVSANHCSDAVPLGLIAEILISEDPPGADLAAAAARMERYTGGHRIDGQTGGRWAAAAKRVLRELPADESRAVLSRADQLLAALYLSDFAASSSTLPSGFEARLAAFAEGLQGTLVNKDVPTLARLERLAADVREHALAAPAADRVERVEMAVRLARWWLTPRTPATDSQSLVRSFIAVDAFVDRARLYLLGGDQIGTLASAFDALANEVRRTREQHNEAFAKALKVWNETRSTMDGLIPVEEIIERVVASLAEHAPVLLLVMDGLSLSVFAELFEDIAQRGWEPIVPPGPWSGTAIAALPTVTEISRASLLCGRLTRGGQQVEKTGFVEHASLASKSRSGARLFHKGE